MPAYDPSDPDGSYQSQGQAPPAEEAVPYAVPSDQMTPLDRQMMGLPEPAADPYANIRHDSFAEWAAHPGQCKVDGSDQMPVDPQERPPEAHEMTEEDRQDREDWERDRERYREFTGVDLEKPDEEAIEHKGTEAPYHIDYTSQPVEGYVE